MGAKNMHGFYPSMSACLGLGKTLSGISQNVPIILMTADICQNMIFLLTGLLTIPFVFSSVFI